MQRRIVLKNKPSTSSSASILKKTGASVAARLNMAIVGHTGIVRQISYIPLDEYYSDIIVLYQGTIANQKFGRRVTSI